MPNMQKKLLIISGTKLPTWSNDSFDQFLDKLNGSDSTLLPPHNTNSTKNGVPLLWESANDFNRKSYNKQDVTFQQRQSSSSIVHSNECGRLKKSLHNSWHSSSKNKTTKVKEEDDYFNDSARTKVGSVTLQQILKPLYADHLSATNKLHGPNQQYDTYNEAELFDERVYLRSVTAPNPVISYYKKPQTLPTTTKDSKLSNCKLIKLQKKLEFLDRNRKPTDELIEKGLKLTRSAQPDTGKRRACLRTELAPNHLLSSSTNFARRSDYNMISSDVSLLAVGMTLPTHTPESSSSAFLKSTHSKIRPGNLLRCLRASPEDVKHRPTWKY